MILFWRSTGSSSSALGSVVLLSLLATDSVIRVRGRSAGAAVGSLPLSCCSKQDGPKIFWLLGLGELTRLRLREGVAIESASDCG